MPLAYVTSESQSGAGNSFNSITAAIGAFNDTGDSVGLPATGVSKLLTLDFAQITGVVDNFLITLRTQVADLDLSPSNLVVAQLYDGATLLGTTTSDTLDSSGAWANMSFVPGDFLIAAVPLDLTANPRTNPTFHLKLTFTNADFSGATISVDGASLATPPTIVSAIVTDAPSAKITVVLSEDINEGTLAAFHDAEFSGGTYVGDYTVTPNAHTIVYVLQDRIVPGSMITVTFAGNGPSDSVFQSAASGLWNDTITNFPVSNPGGLSIPVFRTSLEATGASI